MTHADAMALSAALAEAGISHTVAVGWHEDMAPQVQCRVDVPMPRRYRGTLSEVFTKLEEIGVAHGLELHTGFMAEGLTYSPPAQVPPWAR